MTNTDKNNFNATIGNTVLCDGFLIPMTDFVNNVGNMENYPSHENALSWIYNYANFLRQPLKIEMFVPCDEDGDILDEPEDYELRLTNMMTEYNDEVYRYKQAKEKVLFEGFESYEDYECAKYEDVYIDEEVCDGKFTVEDLIKDTGKTKIKLSQTTLIAIFG